MSEYDIRSMEVNSYGYFIGGDPRAFFPDHEMCTEQELKDHKDACKLWDDAESNGETLVLEDCPSGWRTDDKGESYHVLASRYGIGSYYYNPSQTPQEVAVNEKDLING